MRARHRRNELAGGASADGSAADAASAAQAADSTHAADSTDTAPGRNGAEPGAAGTGAERRRDDEADSEVRTPTFASLAHKDYRDLFIAGLFVFTAIQGQQIARGWLAKELTGSNSGLGGVYLGFGLPMLLLTPLGGVLADRCSKRLVLLAATALLTLSSAWIAIADVTGTLEYWMLVVTAGIQAAGFSIYGPTRVAFTADVVDRSLLPNAIALTQTGLNAPRIVAPTLAGALIGVPLVGTDGVYIGGTVLLVVAMVLAWLLPDTNVRVASTRSPFSEFADGFDYLRANRNLLLLVMVSTVVIVVGMPYLAFLPTLADDIFDVGAAGYGIMNGVAAVGALGVSLWVGGLRLSMAWTIQAIAGLTFGVGLLMIAFSPTFLVALLAVTVAGGAVSGFQAMNNTLVLTESSVEYHGRVQSFLMLGFSGFGFAALPLGIIADSVGLRATLAGMGVVVLVGMWMYLLARRRSRAPQLLPEIG